MKKPGSIIQFNAQRNAELHKAFMAILSDSSIRVKSLCDMFALAAAAPCSRFWVSDERAAEVISALLSGKEFPDMVCQKRRMYDEILHRVKVILEENPGIPVAHAVLRVVNSPAPEFYLTPLSARTIIYRFIRNRKSCRR